MKVMPVALILASRFEPASGAIDGIDDGDSAMAICGDCALTTVTPRACDIASELPVAVSSVTTAFVATSSVGALIVEMTITLAAATASAMSDGDTPISMDAKLVLYAVWLNPSTVPAISATKMTTNLYCRPGEAGGIAGGRVSVANGRSGRPPPKTRIAGGIAGGAGGGNRGGDGGVRGWTAQHQSITLMYAVHSPVPPYVFGLHTAGELRQSESALVTQ